MVKYSSNVVLFWPTVNLIKKVVNGDIPGFPGLQLPQELQYNGSIYIANTGDTFNDEALQGIGVLGPAGLMGVAVDLIQMPWANGLQKCSLFQGCSQQLRGRHGPGQYV
jgi:hypothetical protein